MVIGARMLLVQLKKVQIRRNENCTNMHRSFKMCGLFTCHGQNRCSICCMVYTFVEGKEKLLAPKLDNLLKQQGHCKAKVSMLEVDVNNFYFNKYFVHAKNERCYTIAKLPFCLGPTTSQCHICTKMKICLICCYFPSLYPRTFHVCLWELERIVSAIESEIYFP